MPQYNKLEEDLAIELHQKMMTEEEWLAVFGEPRPTWKEEAEFNRDDFRAQARVAINYLKSRGWNDGRQGS